MEKNIKRRDGSMGRGYYLDFTRKGKRIRAFGGFDLRAAKDELDRLRLEKKAEIEGRAIRPPEPVTFEAQADRFLELYSKMNKRSWKSDELSLRHLKEFFGERLLSEVTAEAVEEYKAKRRAEVSPATVNRELACLKTCLNKAVEWGKLEKSPAAKVKKFREPNSRERFLTIDETNRLLGQAADTLRPVLIVALSTGMRKGEILKLRWTEVDFVKGYIRLQDSKSGKGRAVPMNALVFDLLHEFPTRRGFEFVFENPETKTHVQDVKTGFRAACRRAGLQGVRFHDLRHTAASRMIEAGADLVTVSKILGHASIQMTMRYCHPTPERERAAVQKLGEFLGQPRQKLDKVEIRLPVNPSLRSN